MILVIAFASLITIILWLVAYQQNLWEEIERLRRLNNLIGRWRQDEFIRMLNKRRRKP